MADERIRRQIAVLAAQLMYERLETEYFTAKRKAARQLRVDYKHRPADLPSNREIRDQIQAFARIHEGDDRLAKIERMRLEALRLMRKLARFRPRLIGSVLTGHVRKGSDIDIHVFCDGHSLVTDALENEGLAYSIEHKRIVKYGEERTFTHIHVSDRYEFELTLYPEDKAHYRFRSSITGKAIERASIAELEELLERESPGIDLDAQAAELEQSLDRFEIYKSLLLPLEGVKQNPKHHPEGDALYHSLQVFDLAREHRPYDEEFLLAALLHDVGKAIDPSDHVAAGLEALEGAVTDRTANLIAHHMEALALKSGELGARARWRLTSNEDYDDIMLLRELDSASRKRGVDVPEIDESLAFIRELAEDDEQEA